MSALGTAVWGDIEPKKAIDYWASKTLAIKDEWEALSERERDRAFTAANIENANKLQQVYDIIGESIKNGTPIEKAKKELLSKIDVTEAHAETILRTNIASAYSAGRFQEMGAAVKYRPYWKYISIDDDKTRASHLAMNGIVYPANDPFWTVNFPPNGFRCRCDVASLSARQVRERGVDVIRTKDKPYVMNKAFARNPLDLYKPVLDKYSPQVRQQFIENAVKYANGDEIKLKKLLNQNDLDIAETIAISLNYETRGDVKKWIDNIYNTKYPKGEVAPAGNLPPKVIRFLRDNKSIDPRAALITIDDHRISHAARNTKTLRNAVLTMPEMVSIPDKIRDKATEWYYDNQEGVIYMAFPRNNTDWLKVSIKVDRKVGKGIANEIITAGREDKQNLLSNKFERI